jgi:type IV secretory pathway VirB2 component (pilin)
VSLGASISTSVFASAIDWLEGTLLGSFATALAAIVIASIGLLLFAGRIPTRRAIEVVFGCFILFGASSIASGIMRGLSGSADRPDILQTLPPPRPVEAPVRTARTPYDPYAGTAVPPRR